MVKSYSFNPLWTMNKTMFQETSNLYHILKPIIGRLFQKSFCDVHFGAFSLAKKQTNKKTKTKNAVTLGKLVLAPNVPFFPLSRFKRSKTSMGRFVMTKLSSLTTFN